MSESEMDKAIKEGRLANIPVGPTPVQMIRMHVPFDAGKENLNKTITDVCTLHGWMTPIHVQEIATGWLITYMMRQHTA